MMKEMKMVDPNNDDSYDDDNDSSSSSFSMMSCSSETKSTTNNKLSSFSSDDIPARSRRSVFTLLALSFVMVTFVMDTFNTKMRRAMPMEKTTTTAITPTQEKQLDEEERQEEELMLRNIQLENLRKEFNELHLQAKSIQNEQETKSRFLENFHKNVTQLEALLQQREERVLERERGLMTKIVTSAPAPTLDRTIMATATTNSNNKHISITDQANTEASGVAKAARTTREDGATKSTCSKGIPRIIHFVHVSPHLPMELPPLADSVSNVVQQWREMNPNWEVRLWNNAMVREHYPNLAHLMSNVTEVAWVTDLVRYSILKQFGGVSVETDFIPLRPLDGLCQSSGLQNFIVCQDNGNTRSVTDTPDYGHIMLKKWKCKLASNTVMGFEPNHPAVTEALSVSLKNTKWALSQKDSHARFNGAMIWPASTTEDPTVSILHPYTFLPCSFANKKDCIESQHSLRNDHRVFAMHTWEKSPPSLGLTSSKAAQDRTSTGIPRHIHLIYVSKGLGMLYHNSSTRVPPNPYPTSNGINDKPQIIPQSTLDIYTKWKELHPTWNVTLWDDERVRQWLREQNQPALLDHLSRIPITAWMADVLRFIILEELGGIYLDADVLPLRSMGPLLRWMNDENAGGTTGRKNKGAFSVCQDEKQTLPPIPPDPPSSVNQASTIYYDWSISKKNCRKTNNAVIGAIPHHPFIRAMEKKAIENSIQSLKDESQLGKIRERTWKVLFIAGPWQWDQVIKKPMDYGVDVGNGADVQILRSKPFFPCHYGDGGCKNRPGAYASDPSVFGHHLYAGSWMGE